ncbi:MAG: hydroxymethylpyrimidine/phosphomethylpyrimidine kinase [Salinisphaera sp.]|jgi:hydroxymethylpyrimidine/phosphomethylpyrimidine kinase|nr:hydroxymethylpyrimidine/phosphomethylpyrimidine kinase [Salinisphaera sp.]
MKRPNVLVLAGHDPSGGAGLQADIESIAANSGHAATVTTLLTRQDTANVHDAMPVDDAFFSACIDTLCQDMDLAAAKTGVVASAGQVERIVALSRALPDLPLVVDPVLVAAGGGRLAEDAVGVALRDQLFQHARVITPNAVEARRLCPDASSIDDCGAVLAAYGCAVLITGGDEDDRTVVNRLYRDGAPVKRFEWPRLPGIFHGSGCTLASAIAARLALDEPLDDALQNAQQFTANALASAFKAGGGQAIPNRLYALADRSLQGPER